MSYPDHVRVEARKLWAEGWKRKNIAAHLGVSAPTITLWCRDIPKPIEHRGAVRGSIRFDQRAKPGRFLNSVVVDEDFEAM